MKIKINRRHLCEKFIQTIFLNKSINRISHGEIIYIPRNKYKDFRHDMGILLDTIIEECTKYSNEEE